MCEERERVFSDLPVDVIVYRILQVHIVWKVIFDARDDSWHVRRSRVVESTGDQFHGKFPHIVGRTFCLYRNFVLRCRQVVGDNTIRVMGGDMTGVRASIIKSLLRGDLPIPRSLCCSEAIWTSSKL